MLKTRIISSIIALVLLAAVVSFGHFALGIGIFFMALIGINEFYGAIENAGYKPVRQIGYLSCIPILFIGLNGSIKRINTYFDLFKSINYFSFGLFIIVLVLFTTIVLVHNRYNIIDISLTVFGMFYVAFLSCFVVLTRNLEGGRFYIWLVFIGAYATDTFAYFAGRFFGKHKLLPAISPKKTIEGSIGGIIGCVAITLLYGIFIENYLGAIPLYHYIIIGILNGIISQIGDWSASAIKRHVNIKDYGSIMPGHGGVLDRVDSLLFTAPVVYFYLSFAILK